MRRQPDRLGDRPAERHILYATLAKGPNLAAELQINSHTPVHAAHSSLGITSAIDAGGVLSIIIPRITPSSTNWRKKSS